MWAAAAIAAASAYAGAGGQCTFAPRQPSWMEAELDRQARQRREARAIRWSANLGAALLLALVIAAAFAIAG